MKHHAKGNNLKPSVADRVLQRLQAFTEALEKDEPIGDRFTSRQIELDLKPKPYNQKKVKATRQLLRVSQAMFAVLLGVSPRTVQSWEQGENPPNDMACRFMDEIHHDPKYWRERLKDSARVKKPAIC